MPATPAQVNAAALVGRPVGFTDDLGDSGDLTLGSASQLDSSQVQHTGGDIDISGGESGVHGRLYMDGYGSLFVNYNLDGENGVDNGEQGSARMSFLASGRGNAVKLEVLNAGDVWGDDSLLAASVDLTSGRIVFGVSIKTAKVIFGDDSEQTTAVAIGTTSGKVPALDSDGKLSNSVIPNIAITDTYVTTSQVEMLALEAERGDVAIRTDISKSFILTTEDPTDLANWQELLSPTGGVNTVFGQDGDVMATASANWVLAGPDGESGSPVFRALVNNDIPGLPLSKITNAGTAAGYDVGTIAGTIPILQAGDVLALGQLPAHNHTQLTDGIDTVTLPQLASIVRNSLGDTGVISGCGVAYSGSGLAYNVAAGTFQIRGTVYTTAGGTVTLDTADGTHDRFDKIVANNDGTVSKITGTPASNPTQPNIDDATQIELLTILVPANATVPPDVTLINVYLNNTEWTATSNNGTRVNVNSSNNPRGGSGKCIELTSSVNNDYFQLDKGSTADLTSVTILNFWVRPKSSWAGKQVVMRWFNAAGTAKGVAVSFSNGSYGFSDGATSIYQQITIPISAFQLKSTDVVQKLKFTVNGAIPAYLDDFTLQQGVASSAPQPSFTHLEGDTGTYDAASATDTVKIIGASGFKVTLSGNTFTVGADPSGTIAAARLGLMSAASSGADGERGAVPKPVTGQQLKFLRGDATWADPEFHGSIPLTDASPIVLDASVGTHFEVSLGSGVGSTRALSITNPPPTGYTKKITVLVTQTSGGNRAMTFGSEAIGCDNLTPPLTWSTASGKSDLVGLMWSPSRSKWLITAFQPAF